MQAESWRALDSWKTGCSDSSDLLHLYRTVSPGKDKVFVDIGANRGHVVHQIVTLFSDASERFMLQHITNGIAPACREGNGTTSVLAVEPAHSNAPFLQRLRELYPDHVSILQTAVADREAPTEHGVQFVDLGPERSSRSSLQPGVGPEAPLVRGTERYGVPVTTLDSIIHFLKVDTEGSDPLVLRGAGETLAGRGVDVLVFEYHTLGAWPETSLRREVERVAGYGYECFLMTPGAYFKIRQWSNVACAVRGHPLLRALALHRSACFPPGPDA
eukprot:tig00020934_g16112.t1